MAWAESAYLATHIIGLQSLLPLATLAASGWLIIISIAATRRGLPGLLAIGVLPALGVLVALVAKFVPVLTGLDLIGLGWFIQIANVIVGVSLGIVILGIVLLVPAAAGRFATARRSIGRTDSTR